MTREKLSLWLLKIGIAGVFLYAGIDSFLAPQNWIVYFPPFIRGIIPDHFLLTGFSTYELLLAVWLLSGKKLFYASCLACLTLLGIVTANLQVIDILFRDIAIIFAAASLAIRTYKSQ